MKFVEIAPEKLVASAELARSSHSKQFEERLEASIAEIGLAEPLKVAALRDGKYLIIDGMMRWRAISAIRAKRPELFVRIPAYIVEYEKRFELRFQTDIYQDLLPSQLAILVEHLHKNENITKAEIAHYIGVTPPTLRNYTGLWRLLQREGLFARIVELMDGGVIPASNPYAWLRLTAEGLKFVLKTSFTQGESIDDWIDQIITRSRNGDVRPFPIKFVEEVTGFLPEKYYREGQQVRELKKGLGLRRAAQLSQQALQDSAEALRNLKRVEKVSSDPVLRIASSSLRAYLQ